MELYTIKEQVMCLTPTMLCKITLHSLHIHNFLQDITNSVWTVY